MANGLVISDAGPIFSLAIINRLDILDSLFKEIVIPDAVWEEVTTIKSVSHYPVIGNYFKDKIREVTVQNYLHFVMDYGESEALLLYKELDADYLLIDDKKARSIAESLNIQCIGTIGILSVARENGLVDDLKSIFETFLARKRFYGLNLLNTILRKHGEKEINKFP